MELSEQYRRKLLANKSERTKLIADPKSAIEAEMGPLANKSAKINVLETSRKQAYYVLPTDPLDPNLYNPEFYRIVTKAQKDQKFRAHLLKNSKAALEEELGMALPADLEVLIAEDTLDVINVIVPGSHSEEDDEGDDGPSGGGEGEPEPDPDDPGGEEPGPDDPPEDPKDPEPGGWMTVNWDCAATSSKDTCTAEGVGFCTSNNGCDTMAGGTEQCSGDGTGGQLPGGTTGTGPIIDGGEEL